MNDKTEVKLHIGEEAGYTYTLHESVGFTCEYNVKDESILKPVDHSVTYIHPDQLKLGWSGRDKARAIYLFKAEKSGETTVTFIHMFRF